jgi:hypothetical protein
VFAQRLFEKRDILLRRGPFRYSMGRQKQTKTPTPHQA